MTCFKACVFLHSAHSHKTRPVPSSVLVIRLSMAPSRSESLINLNKNFGIYYIIQSCGAVIFYLFRVHRFFKWLSNILVGQQLKNENVKCGSCDSERCEFWGWSVTCSPCHSNYSCTSHRYCFHAQSPHVAWPSPSCSSPWSTVCTSRSSYPLGHTPGPSGLTHSWSYLEPLGISLWRRARETFNVGCQKNCP